MKENKLADMSMSFSVQIIELVKDLKAKHETVISNQIGRSGTSIHTKKTRNTSTVIKSVAEEIVRIKGIGTDEVASAAEENTRRLFGIQ